MPSFLPKKGLFLKPTGSFTMRPSRPHNHSLNTEERRIPRHVILLDRYLSDKEKFLNKVIELDLVERDFYVG